MSHTSCYTDEAFQEAVCYWDKKDADSVKLDRDSLRAVMEEYIQAHNTCALATGAGDYVRCTPIEYSYHDGCFWIFSEGGRKFIGLRANHNVCLAIYDQYEGFDHLHGMQVMGRAELVEPFSESYNAHAAFKGIPLTVLRKLNSPMHLIRIRPTRIDCLFSEFKKRGCASRQTLILDHT